MQQQRLEAKTKQYYTLSSEDWKVSLDWIKWNRSSRQLQNFDVTMAKG